MTTPVAVGDAAYPTPAEVRDIILSSIRYGFARRGLVANVLPGSDHYIRADAYARRVSIALANNKLALADISPLTAQGQGLIDLAAVFGVYPRPPGPGAGEGFIKSTAVVTIPKGWASTAPDGNGYETVSLQTLSSGQTVALIGRTAGRSTDQAEGTKLTWDSAAIGALNPILIVAPGGITGGTDGDVFENPDGSLNVERLRQRLLLKLAFPAVGGNWSSVVEWAEEASSSVEFAFVYPAVRGPGSYDVVVTRAGGDRTLTSSILAVVASFIKARMPGQNDLNVTSAVAQSVDVTAVAALPLPQSAGGAGGGWRDAVPWPAERTKVTAFNILTGVATVSSTAAPRVGSQIGVWAPDALDANGDPAPAMKEYSIATVAGIPGAWQITVQGGFGFNPITCYVSAGAVHLTEYAAELLAQFEGLGPGEKTDNPDVLPLGRREPTTDVASPSAISSVLLSRVAAAHSEIADLNYGTRYLTGTTTPVTGPSLPGAAADPPNIIVLRNLAIHP